MKKSIALLLVVVFVCSAFVGCGWSSIFDKETTATTTTTVYKPSPPNDELKLEIIKDYLIWSGIQSDKTPNEIDCEFYGVYDESIAVYFHTAGAYQTPLEEEIAGYKFIYPDSRVIRIWNNGEFYRMLEAYEKGWITETNIHDILRAFQSIEFKDPYFIYEPKIYNEPNFSYDTLCYNAVSVVIDKSLSRYGNKEFDVRFFGDVELTEWCELWRSDETHQEFLLLFDEVSSEELLKIFDMLYSIDGIQEVVPKYSGRFDLYPNDEYYMNSTEYTQWALENIEIEKVWDFTVGSSAVRVGIMDSGIADHEDLNDNYSLQDAWIFTHKANNYIESGTKSDYESHGTHIAGIIGAVGNNQNGIVGVNWDVSLVQLQITMGVVLDTTVSRAFDWVIANMNTSERIPIVNLSIHWTPENQNLKSKVAEYIDAGGLLVCSTGNNPVDNDNEANYLYPGIYGSELCEEDMLDNIITVGSIDITNNRPIEFNWGENTIDIYAPGKDILSTIPCEMCSNWEEFCSIGGGHIDYGYHTYSGSSMATPYVSGVAALLLSVNPNLTASQLKECILNGADTITIMVGDNNDIPQTVKKLNAWGAFKYLMENYPIYECNPEYIDCTYSYNIDADALYMKDNTSMMKFNISRAGDYKFTISSDNSMEVELYANDMIEIPTTQTTSYENSVIEFTCNLNEGVYYLRTNFINENDEGAITVYVDCPPHTHQYTEWIKYSMTQHIQCCALCGELGTVTDFHVVKAGSAVGNKAHCMYCGALINTGTDIGQVGPFSITKVTLNGSYILPNGIIVLVDEDIEAYENGTLIFYDKDDLPQTQ